jgi:hypothetical protein
VTTANQMFPASATGGPQVIDVDLNGASTAYLFEGPGTSHEHLFSRRSDGTLSGDPLSGEFTYTFTPSATSPLPPAVPEPSTWAMMVIGFAGLSYAAVRRKGVLRTISA